MQGPSQQELPERSMAPTPPHPQTSGAPRGVDPHLCLGARET